MKKKTKNNEITTKALLLLLHDCFFESMGLETVATG